MIQSSIQRIFYTVVLIFCAIVITSPAYAFELPNHIANADTYVETYMPRVTEDGGSGTGFYVERHYNFALKRLTERYFGEGSMQVVTTPFSDFDEADGGNYIHDVVRVKACGLASIQQSEYFLVNVCNGS